MIVLKNSAGTHGAYDGIALEFGKPLVSSVHYVTIITTIIQNYKNLPISPRDISSLVGIPIFAIPFITNFSHANSSVMMWANLTT